MSPASASLPLDCLTAYWVIGESASSASAWPRITAWFTWSWLSILMMVIGFLPAAVQALLLAGRSSVSSVVVDCTATFSPQALSGSTGGLPAGAAHWMPAL